MVRTRRTARNTASDVAAATAVAVAGCFMVAYNRRMHGAVLVCSVYVCTLSVIGGWLPTKYYAMLGMHYRSFWNVLPHSPLFMSSHFGLLTRANLTRCLFDILHYYHTYVARFLFTKVKVQMSFRRPDRADVNNAMGEKVCVCTKCSKRRLDVYHTLVHVNRTCHTITV